MLPFVVLWLALASAVVGLAVYRKLIARNEDECLHMGETDRQLIARQTFIAQRLDAVDKWGKSLTVVAAVFGAILFAIYIYGVWMSSLRINP